MDSESAWLYAGSSENMTQQEYVNGEQVGKRGNKMKR